MNALPIEPTERDRERFRDLTKAMQFGLEYDRLGIDGQYKQGMTETAFRAWWSAERERQLLQNLNMSQGVKLSEMGARLEKAEAELARLAKQEPVTYVIDFNGYAINGKHTEIADALPTGMDLYAAPVPAAAAPSVPEEWRDKLLAEFPLLDDEGLCQEKHHCEWTLQQDRKRLHALLQPAPAPAVADKRVDELAMLIRRLVRRLNQELPHNDIGEAAMDYLARNGISGEILRGWAAPAVPAANPVQWLEDEGDNILVPRGLLGAACSAIDKQRQAPKVLEAMRHYTMNAPQAPAVPEELLKCWLIERPASSEWPAIWLTITTDGRRWVSDGGTMYATGGDWCFTSAASEALKFADKESADEYVRHNKIKDVVATEHIFDNSALLQSANHSGGVTDKGCNP